MTLRPCQHLAGGVTALLGLLHPVLCLGFVSEPWGAAEVTEHSQWAGQGGQSSFQKLDWDCFFSKMGKAQPACPSGGVGGVLQPLCHYAVLKGLRQILMVY